MGKNDGRGVVFQTGFYDFTGIDFGTSDGAGEEGLVRYQAVLVVQKEHHKLFALRRDWLQPQPVTDCMAGGK